MAAPGSAKSMHLPWGIPLLCHDEVMPALTRLPWPSDTPVEPVEPLRPVLEGFASLALHHPEDVELLPALVDEEGEADEAADPPPALVQTLEEFGGIALRGRVRLDLLTTERSDLGPYTLLGDPTSFYPLIEGDDVAVVLLIDEDGTPGAVYGIGEDLSMTLAARSFGHFLERFLHALTETLGALDVETEAAAETAGAEGGSDARDDSASRLMRAHLLGAVLGLIPEAERDAVEVLGLDESGFDADDLPDGTIAVADLREAALDATAPIMDADIPGDVVELQVRGTHGGQVLALIDASLVDTSFGGQA